MRWNPEWKRGFCVMTLATGLLLTFSACEPKKEGAATMSAESQNVASHSVDGIQIEDVKEGTGEPVRKNDTISVNYIGTLMDGKKFDSSYDRNQAFTFRIGSGQVIEGWEKGLMGMKQGGKRVLVIPPEQAYGKNGAPPVIPPNATLKFEVELVEVQSSAQ